MRRRIAFALMIALDLAGCRNGLSDQAAERLVRAYNDRLIEAYRTGDPRLVEGVAGDEEAKKLTGLIGVKADLGMTLDSRLLELRRLGVERPAGDEVHLLTEERWQYRDRRIGSGEQIGEASTDHYLMRYVLRRLPVGWRVAAVRFAAPPAVGRQSAPVTGEARVFHGMDPVTGGHLPAGASEKKP